MDRMTKMYERRRGGRNRYVWIVIRSTQLTFCSLSLLSWDKAVTLYVGTSTMYLGMYGLVTIFKQGTYKTRRNQ